MTTVRPEQFADTLIRMLEHHAASIRIAFEGDARRVAQECADDLKRTSPKSRSHGKHYASGWKAQERVHGDRISYIVGNTAKPGLTHLLEKGHGGRCPAPAYPHIEPAYNRARAKLIGKLK